MKRLLANKSPGRQSPPRSVIKERQTNQNLSAVNKERLLKIAEKLEDIHISTTETNKVGRITLLEHKFKVIDDFVNENQTEFTSKLHSLKESAAVLYEKLEEDRIEYESIIESNIEEVRSLDDKLTSLYEMERQRRKLTENKIEALFDERFNHLRQELTKENEEMTTAVSNVSQVYESDLEKIKSNLSEEIALREETDTQAVSHVSEEIGKLNEASAFLKETRENDTQKIVAQIQEASDKMKLAVEEQRKIREQSHAQLIDLLDEACKNLKNIEGVEK